VQHMYFPEKKIDKNLTKVWLRIDCDNPLFHNGLLDYRSYLNYLSLKINVKIPNWHNKPLLDSKQFLKRYNIERVWFFHPLTCPNFWNEPFGLHATCKDLKGFGNELDAIELKLGKINYFTRHGSAPAKSGCVWREDEIKTVESRFNIQDLSNIPHYTIGKFHKLNLDEQKNILFHPCHLYKHSGELTHVLDEVIKWNDNHE